MRHERREALEKLQDLSLLVSSKLPSAVTPDVYSSFTQASGASVYMNEEMDETLMDLL